MATWVTHLMIADRLLERFGQLDRRGFCVGSIAPDCNVENADWTEFTPPRQVTHWMQGARKQMSDCDAFCQAYILQRSRADLSAEEYAFLLGYYAHLLTDAAFQAMIRDDQRVHAAWARVLAAPDLCADGLPAVWDSIKKLIPKQERLGDIAAIEAHYLRTHPTSGYLTEILPLQAFPDYIDYLPKGGIVRKIGVMGVLPEGDGSARRYIALSKEEYAAFVDAAVQLVADRFAEKQLL